MSSPPFQNHLPGYTEVADLYGAVIGEEYVLWLDVPVNYTVVVGMLQPSCYLTSDLRGTLPWDGSSAAQVAV